MSSSVILITGTRKGIGKELSRHFLSKSWKVIGCSRGKSSISHTNYIHYEINISNEKDVIYMVRDIYKRFKRIDALINNAGVASMNHILVTPFKTVNNIFQTNFMGTFLFTREVSKIMMKKKYGRIVNFTTVATPLRLEGESIYSASKAAVLNFTEITSKELASFNITVNAIGPTPIKTDLIKNVPKEKISKLLHSQANKRLGTFEDIINVVNFFLKKESDFITGQVIYLGGINY